MTNREPFRGLVNLRIDEVDPQERTRTLAEKATLKAIMSVCECSVDTDAGAKFWLLAKRDLALIHDDSLGDNEQ